MRYDKTVKSMPCTEPFSVARGMKRHGIARDRFGKAGNFVSVPSEVFHRDSMTASRCGFCEKMEQGWRPLPTSAFGYQTKCVLDQLGCIEVKKLCIPRAQAVSHSFETLHILAPHRSVVGV